MRVLLLRKEEENDKYRSKFLESEDCDLAQIPVLNFATCNLDEVTGAIRSFSDKSGFIFTSKRAVDIFVKCINSEITQKIKDANYPIYVVGRSCEEPLINLGFQTQGRDTGNADELADLIILQSKEITKPLVFFCGNIARETIPKKLNQNDINFESIICYCTACNENFSALFSEYIKDGPPDAIVFFSPSGVEFYFNEIEKLFENFADVKICCIGKTTESAILKLGNQVHGVAAKPNPESLLENINNMFKDQDK